MDANSTLSPASIRYQALRVGPDRAAEDSDRDSYADEFAVIPGGETVMALTNAMSEEGHSGDTPGGRHDQGPDRDQGRLYR